MKKLKIRMGVPLISLGLLFWVLGYGFPFFTTTLLRIIQMFLVGSGMLILFWGIGMEGVNNGK